MTKEQSSALPTPRESSIAELYAREAPHLQRLAFLLTGNHHTAEDLTQQAFVRFHARFGSLTRPGREAAYLRQTVVNLARSHHRRAYRRREVYLADPPTPLVPTVDGEERHDLGTALARLPYRQRAALVLRFYGDLSEQQTAHALGCSSAAVKSLTARAMKKLRELVEGDGDG